MGTSPNLSSDQELSDLLREVREYEQALQDDLEVVIGHPSTGESKYGTIAFLETSIEVLETSGEETTMGTGVDQKQVIKRFFAVGDTVAINVTVTSQSY